MSERRPEDSRGFQEPEPVWDQVGHSETANDEQEAYTPEYVYFSENAGKGKITRRRMLGGAAAFAAVIVAGVAVQFRDEIAKWDAKVQREAREREARERQESLDAEATKEAQHTRGIEMVDQILDEVGLSGELPFVGAQPQKTRDYLGGDDIYGEVKISFVTENSDEILERSFPWSMVEFNLAAEGEDETVLFDFDKDELLERMGELDNKPATFLPAIEKVNAWVQKSTYNSLDVNRG